MDAEDDSDDPLVLVDEEIEFAGDVRSHLDRFREEVTRIYHERN